MSPTDPSVARPWALVEAATRWPHEPGPGFGGVVVLERPPEGQRRWDALRAALREVPQEVATVVYLDPSAGDTTGALVSAMLADLADGDDAVAAAVPVTDALKRVDGDRVVASVDRRGLYGLRAPQVLRRPVLDAVLASAPDGPVDPAALLLAAGRRVRMMHVDPAARGGGGG